MIKQLNHEDRIQKPESLAHPYECRHEVVQRLAYEYWEKRGHPIGSPEVDWFAAENDVRSYLWQAGIQLGPNESLYC